jgi:F-type H+-transporting ATPase subunit delta
MKNSKAAGRYAKSLMDLALEQGNLDAVFADMQQVDEVLESSRELRAVLKSPVIRKDAKVKILDQLFESKVSVLTISFLRIVGEKGREALLPEISSSFVDMVKLQKHIMVAKVTSASPLDDESRAKIREIIGRIHEGGIEIVEEVKKDILGGFILNVGDRRIDASILGQIRDLRKQFEKNPYESQI